MKSYKESEEEYYKRMDESEDMAMSFCKYVPLLVLSVLAFVFLLMFIVFPEKGSPELAFVFTFASILSWIYYYLVFVFPKRR